MTAPNTRETADHAELLEKLKRVKYVREAHDEPYGTYDQPCDADDYGAESVPVNPDGEAAINALESLLSDIAALRGRENELIATHTVAVVRIERQRDEARAVLIDIRDVPYTEQEWPRSRALNFLATQGPDQ